MAGVGVTTFAYLAKHGLVELIVTQYLTISREPALHRTTGHLLPKFQFAVR